MVTVMRPMLKAEPFNSSTRWANSNTSRNSYTHIKYPTASEVLTALTTTTRRVAGAVDLGPVIYSDLHHACAARPVFSLVNQGLGFCLSLSRSAVSCAWIMESCRCRGQIICIHLPTKCSVSLKPVILVATHKVLVHIVSAI